MLLYFAYIILRTYDHPVTNLACIDFVTLPCIDFVTLPRNNFATLFNFSCIHYFVSNLACIDFVTLFCVRFLLTFNHFSNLACIILRPFSHYILFNFSCIHNFVSTLACIDFVTLFRKHYFAKRLIVFLAYNLSCIILHPFSHLRQYNHFVSFIYILSVRVNLRTIRLVNLRTIRLVNLRTSEPSD